MDIVSMTNPRNSSNDVFFIWRYGKANHVAYVQSMLQAPLAAIRVWPATKQKFIKIMNYEIEKAI